MARKTKDANATAAALRRLLAKKGWTVYRLAQESGVDKAYLGHVIKGTKKLPLEVPGKLADALGCTIDELR